MRGHAESGDRGWLIAVAPAAFVVVTEGMAWALGAIFASTLPAEISVVALGLAIIAGVLAPTWIVITHRQNAWMWAAISICLTLLGLGIGFFLWFFALLVTCDECLG